MATTTYLLEGSPTVGVAAAPSDWTVPPGVTSIQVDLCGGAGGPSLSAQPGGPGGRVVATIAVTPGQVLRFFAAGTSGAGRSFDTVVAGFSGATHFGGYGIGGGGSGGGFSSVYDVASGTYLVVAGGGGGAGSGAGGTGGSGGLPGTDGTATTVPAGKGGTNSTPGAAGTGVSFYPATAGGHSSGVFGYSYGINDPYSGGDAGSDLFDSYGGGGGGAGYLPGGGGSGASAGSAGGGGGSSYIGAGVTAATYTTGYNTNTFGHLQLSFPTPGPYADLPYGDPDPDLLGAFGLGGTVDFQNQRFGRNKVFVARPYFFGEYHRQSVGDGNFFFYLNAGRMHYADTVTVDWEDGSTQTFTMATLFDPYVLPGPNDFPPPFVEGGLDDPQYAVEKAYGVAGLFRPSVTLDGPGGSITYDHVWWAFAENDPPPQTSGHYVVVSDPCTTGNVFDLYVTSPGLELGTGAFRVPDVDFSANDTFDLPTHWQTTTNVPPTMTLRNYGFARNLAGGHYDYRSSDSNHCVVSTIEGVDISSYTGWRYEWRTLVDGATELAVEVRHFTPPPSQNIGDSDGDGRVMFY